MRTLSCVFVIGLIIGLAAVWFTRGAEHAASLDGPLPAGAAHAEFGCVQGCPQSTAPAPTPCPHCGQSETRWRDLTAVAPPPLLGTSAALLEGSCGQMIYGLNASQRREPASLTKIVTAMAVVENARLDDIVDIDINGWDLVVQTDSSIMGLEAGMQLSVEELLYGLLLPSGNDAALALAGHLGGEAHLVGLMNQIVQRTGLTDTVLRNPHGLDATGAYTTPFDMAILGRELLTYPELASMVSTQYRPEAWHDHGGIWNGDYLLYIYPDAVGIKTGYTEEAGWSIVSAARRDGRLLIASVFNSTDIYLDSMQLFNWAFDNVKPAC